MRGMSPKLRASSVLRLAPAERILAGSISPMRSANLVPGASRSA